jgi:hypothetical protein
MDPHQTERQDPDPHPDQRFKLDSDLYQSDELDPDPYPHQFADDKPKMY